MEKIDTIKASAETLGESELNAVTGGATQNRYDPAECHKSGRTRYECVGLLGATYCDHYKKEHVKSSKNPYDIYHHTCAMGCFDYEGNSEGARYK